MRYPFDIFQIIGYVLLFGCAVYFLRFKFRLLDTIWLTLVTVFAFEIAWEIPANFVTLYIDGIFTLVFVLKHIFMLAPMYLWVYYAWRFGKRWLLGLFVFAVVFELFFVFSANAAQVLTSVGLPWLIRYVWLGVFVVNVRSWGVVAVKPTQELET